MCIFVDLNSIVAEIAARMRSKAGDKLELRTQLDTNLALIKADPKQMDWLLVNLASDAYGGMAEGGELVITTANVELKPGSAREMKLPPGEYVQVELSVAPGHWEVGPMARNIVQRIRGAVAMRGTRGSGLVVDVLLPRASEAAPSLAEPPRRLDGSGPVVLLVSSDPASRAPTSELLRDAGYRAVEAAHGKEAEAILAAGGVDLMIIDIVMPEQDGFETILSVRAIYPGLKIIAVAEREAGYQLRSAKMFGADSVISRPVVRSILRDAIRDQIGGAGRITDT